MYADFVLQDLPMVFSQAHISNCHERMAFSVLSGKVQESLNQVQSFSSRFLRAICIGRFDCASVKVPGTPPPKRC